MGTSKQSELGALIHLLKSCLGTGILSMPLAFKSAGLLVGTLGLIVLSLICTHSSYIMVVCSNNLSKKSGKILISFGEVAEEACRRGPSWSQKYDQFSRKLVNVGIFTGYYTCLSVYTVIIASNFEKVIEYYGISINIRLNMLILLVPFMLICYVPNWKYLTPVSLIANAFMASGIGITLYYIVTDVPSTSDIKLAANISTLPTFLGIVIFSLQAIGAVLPLQNDMERPQKLLGMFGVLSRGLSIVTFLYILIGFLGYRRFGQGTSDNITLNLPDDDYAAQAVQVLISLSVFGAFGVQFFISLDIVWSSIEHRYRDRSTLANYILRTIMVIVAVAIAIAVPTVGPFISLIGAFCFSIVGIILPTIVQIITFWEEGFGKFHWILIKNVVVIMTGVLALVFGTKHAFEDIVKLYTYD